MTTPAETLDQREQRILDTLARLTAMGMELAQATHADAMADDSAGRADVAMKFSRLARCVRQTAALESKLIAAMRAGDRQQAAKAQAQVSVEAERRKRAGFERKSTAGYVVHGYVAEMLDDEDEVEAFNKDLADWIFDDVGDAAYLNKPFADIVIEVMHELGLPQAAARCAIDPEAEGDDAAPFDIVRWEADIRTNYAYMDDWIAGRAGDTRAYAGPAIVPS